MPTLLTLGMHCLCLGHEGAGHPLLHFPYSSPRFSAITLLPLSSLEILASALTVHLESSIRQLENLFGSDIAQLGQEAAMVGFQLSCTL
jgi:SpoVK/Ycf46/Vps4 family AAA+-type ATPase